MANSERYNINLVQSTTVNVANPQVAANMGQESGPGKDAKGGFKGGKGVKAGDKGKSKGRAVSPVRGGGGGGSSKKKP